MNSTEPPQDPRPEPPPSGSAATNSPDAGAHGSQPGDPQPAVRRIYRDSAGPVRGVATGLAHYFGIDPVAVQIGFVLLTIFGGSGILIYLAGWLLIPEADFQDPSAGLKEPGAVSVTIGALFLVASVALIMSFVGLGFNFNGSVVVWLLLLGAGLFLLNQRPEEMSAVGTSVKDLVRPSTNSQPWAEPQTNLGPTPAQPTTPVSPVAPPAPGQQAMASVANGPDGATLTAPAPPPNPRQADLTQRLAAVGDSASDLSASFRRPPITPVPKPVDPGPPITSVTLALAAVTVGLLAGLNQLSGINIGGSVMFSSVLVVCGLGLLFASLKGRAWGLIPVALIAGMGMLASPVTDLTFDGGIGERYYDVQNLAELKDSYQLAAGELTVDLTQIDFESDTTIKVKLGAGSILVLVPDGVRVDAQATSTFGDASAFRHFESGVDVTVHRVEDDAAVSEEVVDTEQVTLTIEAETTFGEVEIRRGN